MIKIEASLTKEGNILLDVTGSSSDSDTQNELDLIYQAIFSTAPKRGGFRDSRYFSAEVKVVD